MAVRRAEPSASRCSWPTTSCRVCGRSRAASGRRVEAAAAVRPGSLSPASKSWSMRISCPSMADDLQGETTELLAALVRLNTVNPPGNERPAQELLAGILRGAGFEVDLVGRTEERPNLVARLRGA